MDCPEAPDRGIRHFIALLEEAGELVRVREEVDWKYEIGDRTRAANRSVSDNHALLFERIKGYEGHQILTNGLGTISRIALSLGLDRKTTRKELIRVFSDRVRKPIPLNISDVNPWNNGNVAGKGMDLTSLPVPWWSREDAGRYLGTWHLNITRDPETGVRNVGVYRMQLLGPRSAAVSVSPRSHLARQFAKAEKKDSSLEMAVAIGVEETLIMAAGSSAPYGQDEFDIAGGLAESPVTLVRCRTIDLEVPVAAEIVIEGNIIPCRRIQEGPFVDYAGVPKGNSAALIFEVTSLGWRENPIFRGAAIGNAGAEDHILYSLLAASKCLDFHGSRVRQKTQNYFLKKTMFREFQTIGSLRQIISDRLQRN